MSISGLAFPLSGMWLLERVPRLERKRNVDNTATCCEIGELDANYFANNCRKSYGESHITAVFQSHFRSADSAVGCSHSTFSPVFIRVSPCPELSGMCSCALFRMSPLHQAAFETGRFGRRQCCRGSAQSCSRGCRISDRRRRRPTLRLRQRCGGGPEPFRLRRRPHLPPRSQERSRSAFPACRPAP